MQFTFCICPLLVYRAHINRLDRLSLHFTTVTLRAKLTHAYVHRISCVTHMQLWMEKGLEWEPPTESLEAAARPDTATSACDTSNDYCSTDSGADSGVAATEPTPPEPPIEPDEAALQVL